MKQQVNDKIPLEIVKNNRIIPKETYKGAGGPIPSSATQITSFYTQGSGERILAIQSPTKK